MIQKLTKENKRWYEELHQVTLPAHQATATESHLVQRHVLEVCLEILRT